MVREENPERNGLVIFQRWMMRLAILQQAKQDAELKRPNLDLKEELQSLEELLRIRRSVES